jgi:hypothetical protein
MTKTLSNVVRNDGHNEWVLRVYTRAGDFQVTDNDEAMSYVSHNCGYIGECDLLISNIDKTMPNVVRNVGHSEWVLRGLHVSL